MRKLVYFHIDELARDAVVAANLKSALAAHDLKLVYGNRNLSSLINRLDSFRRFDLYVFSNLDLFMSYVPNIAHFDAPVIILPTENIGGTTCQADRLVATFTGCLPNECMPWRKKAAAFCLWGPSRLKIMEEICPDLLPRCYVVGHPRYDDRCQRDSNLPKSNKIRVGIISRFVTLNVFDRRTLLDSLFGSDEDDYRDLFFSPNRGAEDTLYTETVDLLVVYRLIRNLDPELFEIVIRVHPREDRTAWEELITKNKIAATLAPWDMPFMHWVEDLDHIVGPPSTSFYDCFALGKTPICIDSIVPRRNDHLIAGSDDENEIINYSLRPKSMKELVNLLSVRPEKETVFPDGLHELLKQETNYPDSKNSLDAFANVCTRVLESTSPARQSNLFSASQIKVLSKATNLARMVLKYVRRSGNEQSATFILNGKRKRFVDSLAHSESRRGR